MSGFTIEAFTLLGVGLSILALRVYARINAVGIRGLEWDDHFMVFAAILYTAETTLAYSVGAYWHGLANNAMIDAEREALDPSSYEYMLRVNGSKTQVAGWAVYVTLLWTLKAAMCTFYLRLTEGLENYRSRIYAGFVLIFLTWIIVLLSVLLGCRPLHNYWQINPDPGNSCQPAISKINLFVTVVLNGATDAYLLSIPLPMLWSVRLPVPKKFGLIALFSGGIFVITAGTLRCVLILTNPVKGAEQAGYWAVRETFVAVVTTNLPVVFPFIRRKLIPILGSLSSTARSGDATTKRGVNPMPGSIRLDDIPTGNASMGSNGGFRKRGASISHYPIGSDNDSDGSLHMVGIRKDTDVEIVSEGRRSNSATPDPNRDLATALYGQPGVRGTADVQLGNWNERTKMPL